jgi:hypothetical protein
MQQPVSGSGEPVMHSAASRSVTNGFRRGNMVGSENVYPRVTKFSPPCAEDS